MQSRLARARRIFPLTVDVAAVGYTLVLLFQLGLFAVTAPEHLPWWRAVGTGLCTVGIAVCFLRIHRAAFHGWPRPTVLLVVSGLLGVGALAFSPDVSGDATLIFWLLGMVLHVRRRYAFALVIAVIVVNTTAVLLYGGAEYQNWSTTVFVVYVETIWTVGTTLLMLLWVFAWRTINALSEAQDARAKLAVSEERLRFARDLHDLLGHNLSVIALKSELAAKLASRDADRSGAEMTEVHALAREALREMRSAVRGYRTLDLDEELANTRAILTAAGIQCTVNADTADLPAESRQLLAWAVREGTTNVLKHSAASHCTVTIANGVLEITNDGADATPDGTGSGLRGLTERISAAGGTVAAAPRDGGGFLLRAAVPAG